MVVDFDENYEAGSKVTTPAWCSDGYVKGGSGRLIGQHRRAASQ
ncbi:MAG: hypothetical protein P1T08_03770 [Acidimicrobiia bacterium]|nr:hypothetical protein [Acidimicrobiia bacterium]